MKASEAEAWSPRVRRHEGDRVVPQGGRKGPEPIEVAPHVPSVKLIVRLEEHGAGAGANAALNQRQMGVLSLVHAEDGQ